MSDRKQPQFSGDPTKDNAAQFWKNVRAYFRGSTEAEKCIDFDILLNADSAADRWFAKLSAETKKSWGAIEKAFKEEWIKDPPPRMSDAEAIDVITANLPTLQDLLKYENHGQAGRATAHYQLWIRKLYSDATVEEYSPGLAEQVRCRLPRPLRDLVEPVNNWEQLRDNVEKVNATRLRERVTEELKEQQEREEWRTRLKAVEASTTGQTNSTTTNTPSPSIEDLAQQLAALTMRNGQHPVSSSPYYASPAYPPWTAPPPRPPASYPPPNAYRYPPPPQPYAPPPAPTPAQVPAPARAPGARQWPTFEERHAILMRNAKPAPPNTEEGRNEYARAVAEWQQANPLGRTDEHRPYPLTPGTQPVGGNDCYTCGMYHPRGDVCTASRVPEPEQRWRRIAGSIARGVRRPQEDQAPYAAAVHHVAVEQSAYAYAPPSPWYPPAQIHTQPHPYYQPQSPWHTHPYEYQYGPGNA